VRELVQDKYRARSEARTLYQVPVLFKFSH
jgi:hypothetical protein